MSQSFSQTQARQNRQQRLWHQKWSLKTKAIVWALSISVLPVVAIGTATYYYGINLITKQIPKVKQESGNSTETELALHRQLSLLLTAMGGTAILAGAKIHDPCFTQGYVEKYQSGRVVAINNIHESGLSDCHINLLESFAVKANLVAPIIKDEQLFGLLIAHQCSEPRNWQQSEIDLFSQIAMQVGFTLDHARLLQAYEAAEANSN
ncbi:GAF domain-containing protein [Nostoc sp.]|uniref:GAF domain-containing protein n=1 Tax=Nostoc sp. TaxID=1180 RepID=UPI002FFCDF35